jgi:hypothetical protein
MSCQVVGKNQPSHNFRPIRNLRLTLGQQRLEQHRSPQCYTPYLNLTNHDRPKSDFPKLEIPILLKAGHRWYQIKAVSDVDKVFG